MAEQYPYSGVPQAAPNSTTAIISLIAGILGITVLPFIGSIVALITGYMAKKEIRESAGALGGDGLATGGLVLGWIGIGLGVLTACGIGLAIGLPFCLALFGAGLSEFNSFLPGLLAVL
jgi:hypothetical protein